MLLTHFSGLNNDYESIIARDHHEKSNGSGYPAGRKFLDLNTEIVIACDIYDALLSPRSYRKECFDNRTALEELSLKALEGKSSPGIESPVSQLEISFGFYSQPEGPITFEYREGISPNDYISNFKDHEILISCNGFGSEKTYFIPLSCPSSC